MIQNIEQTVPQGSHWPAVWQTDLILTSGYETPKAGILINSERIRDSVPIESHRDAVRPATLLLVLHRLVNLQNTNIMNFRKINF